MIKSKQPYLLLSSFAFLAFVMLGYCVKFTPEVLKSFDAPIQTAIRGQLPQFWTTFFSSITVLGNTSTQVILVVIVFLFFRYKKWYVESYYMLGNGLISAICILSLKNIYQRPRPSISHLVEAHGYSFPSGHSMGSILIIGGLTIVLYQRMASPILKKVIALLLGVLILLIGISRIYVGVHYPTDVMAGFLLGSAFLSLLYPFYLQKRFEWRFKSKQK